MASVTVERLEERWTSTTIQTAFVFHSMSSEASKPGGISIDFPLLNLGWTFALRFTPVKQQVLNRNSKIQPSKSVKLCNWIPAAFSFRQHGNAIRWGNTSIHAQFSLGEECTPQNDPDSTSTPSGAMNFVVADTPSFELPLTGTTYCTISLLRPNKVWLTVVISECPLPNGLFGARLGPVNEAEAQGQSVRQNLLTQSLTTGKLVDVKFLSFSARSTSRNTGEREPFSTYASLSVLEEHINLSSSILREGWSNALATLDSIDAKHVVEISCPNDYEYELDSDFEDEDESQSAPYNSGFQGGLTIPEGQQSERGAESSLSSFVPEGVGNQILIGRQPEEVIKDAKEPPSDYGRTVQIKFAAHRTWHAFLWYCYTGNLEFRKLKSQAEPGQHLHVTPVEGGPPSCSPKSMYRLADLVGDKDLKAKALMAIKGRMTATNVLDEAFSVFTSKYPDIREVQLGVLMEHCRSPRVKAAFLRAMVKYSSTPHAEPVLSAFYDNLVA